MKTSLDNLENTMLDIKQSVVTRFLLKNNFPPGIINLQQNPKEYDL